MKIKVGILTISTSCYYKGVEDRSGKEIEDICKDIGLEVLVRDLVPDNKRMIKKKLKYFSDRLKLDIVFTTGGTGLGPADITPEATLEIGERVVPGIPEFIRAKSMRWTKYSILSRAVAVIRKKTLIINLPGSPKGARQSLNLIKNLFPHIVEIMAGGHH